MLGIVAYNADAATWDKLHAMAKAETSSMIRDQYYGLLAISKDKALAQKALDMALTDEPGATNSAAMISRVAGSHPDMVSDFAGAPREGGHAGRYLPSISRYYPGLGGGSDKLEMVQKLKDFADKDIGSPDLAPRYRDRDGQHSDPDQAQGRAPSADRGVAEEERRSNQRPSWNEEGLHLRGLPCTIGSGRPEAGLPQV